MVVEFLPGHIGTYERNLLPDQQTTAVGLLKHEVSLRVVSQTDRVHTHLLNDVQIGQMLLPRQGASQPCPVLMTGHTPQLQVITIQEEPLVGINVEVAQAYLVLHPVHLFPVALQHGRNLVEIRVAHPVPQVRILHGEVDGTLVVINIRRNLPADDLTSGIQQGQFHFTVLVVRKGREVNLCLQFRMLLSHQLLSHQQTVGAIVKWRDAHIVHNLQVHIPVETAIEVEVAPLRSHIKLVGVVARNQDIVLDAVGEVVGEFKAESIIRPLVRSHMVPVHKHRSRGACALALQEDTLSLPALWHLYLLQVRAQSPVVALIVHEILIIVCMRQVHRLVCLRDIDVREDTPNSHATLLETPTLVEVDDFSGRDRKAPKQENE